MPFQEDTYYYLFWEPKYLAFEVIKDLYAKDEDFKDTFEECFKRAHGLFHIEEGFLFKGARLCVPKCGFQELIIQE